MMKKFGKRMACLLLCAVAAIWSASAVFAQEIQVPKPTSDFANDFAGILSDSTKEQINEESRQLEKEKGIQFVVVTVQSLSGESIEDYANALFNQWGIGSKDTDQGLLLLVSKEDRRDRIEVGNGLQGDLTDVQTDDLLESGKPYLKKNDFDAGIRAIYSAALNELGMTVSDGMEPASAAEDDRESGVDSGSAVAFVVIALVCLFSAFSRRGRGPRGPFGGMPGGFFGGFGGGNFGGFGGGDGGGSFGGFSCGGGSSDGGGASGSF